MPSFVYLYRMLSGKGSGIRLYRFLIIAFSSTLKPVMSPQAHVLPPQSHLPSTSVALISLASLLYRCGVCLTLTFVRNKCAHNNLCHRHKTFMREREKEREREKKRQREKKKTTTKKKNKTRNLFPRQINID